MSHGSRPHALADEHGMTVAELIVAVGLLGVLLMISWGAYFAIARSNDVSTAQSNAALAFSDPLEEMSKIIMQNTEVSSAATNRIEVWTDRNLDGLPELNAFYANSAGQLVWEYWQYNSSRTTASSHKTWVMDSHNANVQTNTPLFTYYDKQNAEITGSNIAAHAPSDTVFMKATVVVSTGSGATTSSVRQITFRNRG